MSDAHFNTLASCFIRSQLQTQAKRLNSGHYFTKNALQINHVDKMVLIGLSYQRWRLFRVIFIMYKDIHISQNCEEVCVKAHRLDRSHKTMEVKRFKNRIRQFLSQDDEYWIPAFEKIEQIQAILKDFRSNVQKKIEAKKILYSLNYDTDGLFLKIFTLANNDEFNRLTCQDAALIENRINKGRSPNQSQVKNLISGILQQASEDLKEKIDRVLNDKPSTIPQNRRKDQRNDRVDRPPREEKAERRERPEREQRTGPREYERNDRRGRQRGDQGEKQPDDIKRQAPTIRENGLPTIKMRDVPQTDTHFNIQVKIIEVKKVFTLGPANKKKIEFEGGDETGVSSFVVDAFKFIRPGTVIHISNAKIYSFHGNKQIQQNLRGSLVTEMTGVQMKVLENNNIFGQRRPARRRRQQPQREKSSSKQSKDVANKGPSQNRRPVRAERDQNNRDRDQSYRRERADREQNYRRERVEKVDRVGREQNRQYRRREERQSVKVQTSQRPIKKFEQQRAKRESSSSSSARSSSQQLNSQPKKEQPVPSSSKKPTTKIANLEPGQENLNIIAEITRIFPDSDLVPKSFLLCQIGDETGVVLAELPQHHPDVKTNVVLFLESVEAAVHQTKKFMIVKLMEESLVQRTTIRMAHINLEMNMSEQLWESQQEEDKQEEQEEEEVDDRDSGPKGSSNTHHANNVEDF